MTNGKTAPFIGTGLLLPAIQETRQPPANLNLEDQDLFAHEYTKDISPCIYHHLNDVKILGRYWLYFRPFKVLDRYRQTGDPITLRGALGRIARRISCLPSLLKANSPYSRGDLGPR